MADESASPEELVTVVYIDANVLLDLLATVEDGFAVVEHVTFGRTRETASERSVGAELAVPGVLNFFKLGLSGKLGRSTASGQSDTRQADVTHTPGSLLHRLRRYLIQQELVRPLDEVAVGQFIEFKGVVRPNSFAGSIRLVRRTLNFQRAIFAASHGGHKTELEQVKILEDFCDQLIAEADREGTITVLVKSTTTKYNAVVTLYEDFLRAKSMVELLNREFRVLGKVVRHLPQVSDEQGSDETVDLIHLSGISGLSAKLMEDLIDMVDDMEGQAVAMPETQIKPPVLEIIPIAIYL